MLKPIRQKITWVKKLAVLLLIFAAFYLTLTQHNPIYAAELRILNVSVDSITSHTARITWKTNLPATSKVNYGEQIAAQIYTRSTPENETPSLEHRLELAELKSATIYQFQVVSRRQSGETATSDNRTFTTLAETNPTASTQTNEDGFAALLTPPTSKPAPRVNPYAEVLGSYVGPTPPTVSQFVYNPNYPNLNPPGLQPLTVVYPPMYQLPPQTQVLAAQQPASPPPTHTLPTPTPSPPLESLSSTQSLGGSTATLLLIGIIVGTISTTIFLQLRPRTPPPPKRNQTQSQATQHYEFSLGG